MHGVYLAINPEMEEMTDTIVLTCLLAEQELRICRCTRLSLPSNSAGGSEMLIVTGHWGIKLGKGDGKGGTGRW